MLRFRTASKSNLLWHRNDRFVAMLFLSPALVYLFLMSLFPLFYSLWLSFQHYVLYRPDNVTFVGWENFRDLLFDDIFLGSFKITIIFSAVAVTLEFVIGLAVAVLLNRKMGGVGVLRTLLIVPILISPVGIALTFRYIFAPSYGLLNYLLQGVGLPTGDWLVSPTWALPVVIFVDVWQWTPFVALTLLAGMQSVSVEVIEAADLDGLNEWQKLRRIVMPLIAPIVIVVVLIRLIDSIKMFDLVFVMTRGGPGTATETLSIYGYITGFSAGSMGYASAIAWSTVIFVNILVAVFLRYLGRMVK